MPVDWKSDWIGILKTRAAVLFEIGQPFEIVELDLDRPGPHEVLVKIVAAGVCHTELHLRMGDIPGRLPLVGGHEASAIVEEVGENVSRVKPGDHVVCTFVPSCGTCRYCSTARQHLCVLGANMLTGELPGGGFRMHHQGQDVGGTFMLGTFSERAVISEYAVVKVDQSLDLKTAALLSCSVPTGWGTATSAGEVKPGDVVVVFGAGGVGLHAVQGATYSGASEVIVVDPVRLKRDAATRFGATYAFEHAEAAIEKIRELTSGDMADKALVTVGRVDDAVAVAAVNSVGKSGTVVITSAANQSFDFYSPSNIFLQFQKVVKGSIYGSTNPQYDIPRLAELGRTGDLKLDGLISRTYSLDQVNEGYADLNDGKIIRGMIVNDTE
ncbi:NDMA-dependent alcohol dehydrogenase [Micromonospora sp. NPDC049559]|uniref:NDMA-dependent alcohol dehydrogenase n=1 Tax=Micromonospora sp. NPDC049559 TaxID=3155923 RepID=UPI003436F812